MFIENISLVACEQGWHFDPGPNSVLIQIVDNDMQHPIPKYPFKEIYQFKFLDVELEDEVKEPFTRFDYQTAKEVVSILQKALDNRSNVIVHCVAGICRSGAVTEVGVIMGFEDTEVYRQPNLLVKSLMIQAWLDSKGI